MSAHRVVVTDASVLINFLHIAGLTLLGQLDGYEFLVPDDVHDEILLPGQRADLDDAVERGDLHRLSIADEPTLELFAELRAIMGKGEAACLAAAVVNGYLVACDEKRAFRREAIARLGSGRLLTTAGIIVLAIRGGLITVAEADAMKATLEKHRFRMGFGSFGEVV